MEKLSNDNPCEYCSGMGSVHPVVSGNIQYDQSIPCVCVKEELEENRKVTMLKSCKFPPIVSELTFENFDNFTEVQSAYIAAKNMADNPGDLAWLVLLGINGVGKTHLAVATCKAWVDAGIPARYSFVPLLLDELREGFNRDGDGSYQNRFDYYCRVPLLLLDDLGMESKTAWVQEKLETIVDFRLMNKLSLIITCNKSLDELSPRISSRLPRLNEKAHIINIDAD
ncbi:hypothetical protein LCGC14_2008340, partial [marine sediment metagenome]